MSVNNDISPIIKIKANQTVFFPITDESYISVARRESMALAKSVGFSQSELDKIAIIVSELGSNLLKHASQFKERILLFQVVLVRGKKIFEIMSLDHGPGMISFAQCLQDGYSTTKTAGNGLGAVSRFADFFNVYSLPESGTITLAHIQMKNEISEPAFMDISGICLPISGEKISGDSWSSYQSDKRCLMVVADGLGHGPEASKASELACQIFQENTHLSPGPLISLVNTALKKTRGAAVSIVEIDKMLHQIKFAGLGNISAMTYLNNKTQHMVSHDGTAGVGQHHVQEYVYQWDPKALFLMYSDGLISRWSLDPYPGLTVRHLSLIAGALYRDYARGNDDITVLVGRQHNSHEC